MSAIRLLQAGRQEDIRHLHRQLMSGGILQKELWEEAESFLIKKRFMMLFWQRKKIFRNIKNVCQIAATIRRSR